VNKSYSNYNQRKQSLKTTPPSHRPLKKNEAAIQLDTYVAGGSLKSSSPEVRTESLSLKTDCGQWKP